MARHFPRSPLFELDGYPWLARVIDKVRGALAGQMGEYTPFPGGIDTEFVRLLGVDANALRAVIEGGADDSAVADWVRAHQAPGAAERVEAFRKALLAPSPAEFAEELAEEIATLSAGRPDLDFSQARSFVQVICVEEGHPWPVVGSEHG